MRLVVVESPNKVKKISGFLGPGYQVVASFGHVADLPASGDLAVQFTDGQVIPHYQALERSQRAMSDIRRLADRAETILLATDPDREGEAIAWHVMRLLGFDRSYQRVVFNAITESAVKKAVANARSLDQHLVDAQQARRVLDRVVGWVVSPTLRRGCGNRLAKSAGRVQSAALRLVCEREEAIANHATAVFFAIDAEVEIANGIQPPSEQRVIVSLEQWKGEDLGHRLDSRELAERSAAWCAKQNWEVLKRESRPQRRRPPPPFTTATVQQAASLRLRYNPKQTMATLQRLFEQGHITYHRTDSTALDPEAVACARRIIGERFGQEFLPAQAVIHHTSSANTQEAHEAIRPTHPESGPDFLGGELGPLYQLIWQRFIACQMADGEDQIDQIDIGVACDGWRNDDGQAIPVAVFRAQITREFKPGWRKLGIDSTQEKKTRSRTQQGSQGEGDEANTPRNTRIPNAQPGDRVDPLDLRVRERKTKAPARYTQASLIKRLEKEGIGRPSTYAAIMSTLLDRAYVNERARKLHATDLGMQVTRYLTQHFAGDFIELSYTAQLENDLDAIARGNLVWHEVVTRASFQVRDTARAAGLWYDPLAGGPPAPDLAPSTGSCPLCGGEMLPRNGPYGAFYACSKRSCPAIVNPNGSPNRRTQQLINGKHNPSKPSSPGGKKRRPRRPPPATET